MSHVGMAVGEMFLNFRISCITLIAFGLSQETFPLDTEILPKRREIKYLYSNYSNSSPEEYDRH